MAEANNTTRSDLDAAGSPAPEFQPKGGEPTPAAGTFGEPGDHAETDPAEYAKLLDFYDSSFRNLAEGASSRTEGSRGYYWLGRALEAQAGSRGRTRPRICSPALMVMGGSAPR